MTSIDHDFARGNRIRNQAIGNRQSDPLPRLLAQLIERAGEGCSTLRASSRPWASALFQGRRHVITLSFEGTQAQEQAARFAQGIEEAEWNLPRHFVADITMDVRREQQDGVELELSALTIEDW